MYRATPASTHSGLPPRGRQGITLIEVLVCLMLLSLLAAAVFPVVTQRVARGEPLRAMQELSAVSAGIEAFAADMRGSLPGDLEDLSVRIDAFDRATRAGGEDAPFTEAEALLWAGPYLAAPLADGGFITTGFGVPIRDDLIRFDGSNNAPIGTAGFRPNGPSQFLAVQVGSAGRQLTASQFEAINDLIDGTGEPDGPGPNTSWSLGRFRFDDSLVAADSVGYYLAARIDR